MVATCGCPNHSPVQKPTEFLATTNFRFDLQRCRGYKGPRAPSTGKTRSVCSQTNLSGRSAKAKWHQHEAPPKRGGVRFPARRGGETFAASAEVWKLATQLQRLNHNVCPNGAADERAPFGSRPSLPVVANPEAGTPPFRAFSVKAGKTKPSGRLGWCESKRLSVTKVQKLQRSYSQSPAWKTQLCNSNTPEKSREG